MAVGPWQILLVLLVLVVLFGAGRLPQLGKNLGSGIRNFKKGLTGSEDEGEDDEGTKELKGKDDAPR